MANQVELDLLFEIKDAVKNLNDFTQQAKKNANTIDNVFTGLTVAATAFVGVFTTGKVIGFFEDAVAASSEAEVALNQLNSALAISGNLVPGASKAFQNFAEQLQATTTLEDDTIIKTGALIESMTQLDQEGLQKATLAAANLSAAIGIDLDSAARLVSKSVEGQTSALKKYGITVKEGATEAETLSNVINTLNDRFGGAAAAQIRTYSGAITQARNAYGDILESLGDVITHNSAVIVVINKAAEAFRKIKEFIDENKQAISNLIKDGIVSLIRVLPNLIEFLDILNSAFLKLKQGIAVLKTGINSLTGFIAKLGLSKDAADAVAEAVDEDNIAIVKSTQLAEENAAKRSKFIQDLVSKTRDFVDETEKEIEIQSKSSSSFIKNNEKKLNAVTELTEAQKKLAKEEAERIQKLSTLKLDQLQGNFNVNVVLPKDTEGQIALGVGALNKTLEGAKGATELVSSALGTIANAFLPGIGAAIQQLVTVLAQGPEKVRELIDQFFQALPAVLQNIILAIPVLIQALIDNLPTFIEALVNAIPVLIIALIAAVPDLITSIIDSIPLIIQNLIDQLPLVIQALVERVPELITAIILKIPDIIQALVSKIPTIAVQFGVSLAAQAPFIATQMAVEFVKQIPAIAKGIAEAIPKAITGAVGDAGKTVGSIGKTIGGALGGIGKLFGFAGGGQVQIPRGDTLIAGFNAEETVIDKSTTDELKSFLAQQRLSQQSSGQNLNITLQVGESQLAQVLLNLNRQGFRIA